MTDHDALFDTKPLLALALRGIEANDGNYELRYGLVLQALHLAHGLGYPAGIRIDPSEPEWPVAYIELPEGQCSWHLPQHPTPWDGHDTAEKYRRCRAHTARVLGDVARRVGGTPPPQEGHA